MERLTKYFITRNPKEVFELYLLTIFMFGYAYWVFSVPFSQGGDEVSLSLAQATYFSAVTITTLGYGDISPLYLWGMLLTGVEAILGIVTLGLFLNSLSMAFVNVHREESKRHETKIAVSLRYLHNMSPINHYFYSTRDLIRYLDKIKFPAFKGGAATEEEIEAFQSSIDTNFSVIPIQMLKRIMDDKSELISVLDDIYSEADPIININLKANIDKIKTNNLHAVPKNAIETLDEYKKHILKNGDEHSVSALSSNLLSIKEWLIKDSKLIGNIKSDLDDISDFG